MLKYILRYLQALFRALWIVLDDPPSRLQMRVLGILGPVNNISTSTAAEREDSVNNASTSTMAAVRDDPVNNKGRKARKAYRKRPG